jgi:hypothetical protein
MMALAIRVLSLPRNRPSDTSRAATRAELQDDKSREMRMKGAIDSFRELETGYENICPYFIRVAENSHEFSLIPREH